MEEDDVLARRLGSLTLHELRKLTYALLREGGSEVATSPRGAFVDFSVTSVAPLGLPVRHRFRLFPRPVSGADLEQLQSEALAGGLAPVAVAPHGLEPGIAPPPGVAIVDRGDFHRRCQESGILIWDSDSPPRVDPTALAEVRDHADATLALLNGLLWLRPLSRNRLPAALRWTHIPAHELFERSFFLTMTTTFRAVGASWGTRKRGKAIPDGLLLVPGTDVPTLYDCKAARDGYSMTYRDLTGFADYIRNPLPGTWTCPDNVVPRFLVISSEVHGGAREASFSGRQQALSGKVPGARLVWMRARDLVRFGLTIERAQVTPIDRETIHWAELLDAGDVQWEAFQNELHLLSQLGYTFPEAS